MASKGNGGPCKLVGVTKLVLCRREMEVCGMFEVFAGFEDEFWGIKEAKTQGGGGRRGERAG
jgi:hypothetical protein